MLKVEGSNPRVSVKVYIIYFRLQISRSRRILRRNTWPRRITNLDFRKNGVDRGNWHWLPVSILEASYQLCRQAPHITCLTNEIAQRRRRNFGQLMWTTSGKKEQKNRKSIHPSITLFTIMCTNNNDYLMNQIKKHLFKVPKKYIIIFWGFLSHN